MLDRVFIHMKSQTEILIVGGGAVGVSSAYYLNAAGRDVTLVDKVERFA